MPLLKLNIAGHPTNAEQRIQLQSGLTNLMVDLLRKVGSLTVVHVNHHTADGWSVGGRALNSDEWTASLEVFITDGTNSEDEQATFIASAKKLIDQTLGQTPATPVYIILHNIKAAHWGYDGQTQLARRNAQIEAEKRASTH